MSEALGGSFRDGFIASVISAGVSGVTNALWGGTAFMESGAPWAIAGRTVLAGVMGGTASVATGGKFAHAALTSAFLHLYNDLSSYTAMLDARRIAADAAKDWYVDVTLAELSESLQLEYERGRDEWHARGINYADLELGADSPHYYWFYDKHKGGFGFDIRSGAGLVAPELRGLAKAMYANHEINYHVVGIWSRIKGLTYSKTNAIFEFYTAGAKAKDKYQVGRKEWLDIGWKYADRMLRAVPVGPAGGSGTSTEDYKHKMLHLYLKFK